MRNCPFCGSSKVKVSHRDASFAARNHANKKPKVYVLCNKCKARGPILRSEEGAVKAWNGDKSEEPPLMQNINKHKGNISETAQNILSERHEKAGVPASHVFCSVMPD